MEKARKWGVRIEPQPSEKLKQKRLRYKVIASHDYHLSSEDIDSALTPMLEEGKDHPVGGFSLDIHSREPRRPKRIDLYTFFPTRDLAGSHGDHIARLKSRHTALADKGVAEAALLHALNEAFGKKKADALTVKTSRKNLIDFLGDYGIKPRNGGGTHKRFLIGRKEAEELKARLESALAEMGVTPD